MGKPRRAHLQMLRSFTWADLFTFGNVSCGTVSLFLCLYYLTEGQRGFLWAIFGLLPLAAVFDGLDGYVARRWGQARPLAPSSIRLPILSPLALHLPSSPLVSGCAGSGM
jgi:CDP-alcohol phosphatidyltransferase